MGTSTLFSDSQLDSSCTFASMRYNLSNAKDTLRASVQNVRNIPNIWNIQKFEWKTAASLRLGGFAASLHLKILDIAILHLKILDTGIREHAWKCFFEKDVKTVATKRCEKTGNKSLFSISLIAEHARSLQTLPSLHPSPPGSKEHLRRLLSELTEWHRAYLSASDYRTTHSTADNRECGREGRSHFVELY